MKSLTDDAESTRRNGTIAWWREKDDEARAKAADETLQSIRREQEGIRSANLRHMRMYRNLALVGLGPGAVSITNPMLGAPLSLNVVRNMCNAVTSKIAKNRPKMWFQTSGASPAMKTKARKLEKFIEGVFYKQRFYEKLTQAFLNATIFGTGMLKVVPDHENKEIIIECVFTPEVRVDNVEGANRCPRNIYQSKYIDREVVKALYPKRSKEIDNIERISATDDDEEVVATYETSGADMIRVDECYHLPSSKRAKDGMLVTCAGGIELETSKWEYDDFPFIPIRWSTSPLGYWGMGLAEELVGIQTEINRLVRKIQASMQLLANPYVLADRASNIQQGHITDIPGSVILYSGREPRVHAPSVVHPEVFTHLDRLYQRAYEIAGISQMSAQSQKPVGFESGRAILVFQDIESERFATVTRELENAAWQAANKILEYARDMPGYKVKVFGDESLEEIDFKRDIDLESDEWVMKIKPTSVIGDSPSGQLDEAARLIKMGLIQQPEEVLEESTHPDIQALVRRKTASKRLVEKMVQTMLDGGPEFSPEPHMNLSLTLGIAQEMYIEAKLQGAKERELQKVRKFMRATVRMIKMAQGQGVGTGPGAPPPAGPPQGPPQGVPPMPVAA